MITISEISSRIEGLKNSIQELGTIAPFEEKDKIALLEIIDRTKKYIQTLNETLSKSASLEKEAELTLRAEKFYQFTEDLITHLLLHYIKDNSLKLKIKWSYPSNFLDIISAHSEENHNLAKNSYVDENEKKFREYLQTVAAKSQNNGSFNLILLNDFLKDFEEKKAKIAEIQEQAAQLPEMPAFSVKEINSDPVETKKKPQKKPIPIGLDNGQKEKIDLLKSQKSKNSIISRKKAKIAEILEQAPQHPETPEKEINSDTVKPKKKTKKKPTVVDFDNQPLDIVSEIAKRQISALRELSEKEKNNTVTAIVRSQAVKNSPIIVELVDEFNKKLTQINELYTSFKLSKISSPENFETTFDKIQTLIEERKKLKKSIQAWQQLLEPTGTKEELKDKLWDAKTYFEKSYLSFLAKFAQINPNYKNNILVKFIEDLKKKLKSPIAPKTINLIINNLLLHIGEKEQYFTKLPAQPLKIDTITCDNKDFYVINEKVSDEDIKQQIFSLYHLSAVLENSPVKEILLKQTIQSKLSEFQKDLQQMTIALKEIQKNLARELSLYNDFYAFHAPNQQAEIVNKEIEAYITDLHALFNEFKEYVNPLLAKKITLEELPELDLKIRELSQKWLDKKENEIFGEKGLVIRGGEAVQALAKQYENEVKGYYNALEQKTQCTLAIWHVKNPNTLDEKINDALSQLAEIKYIAKKPLSNLINICKKHEENLDIICEEQEKTICTIPQRPSQNYQEKNILAPKIKTLQIEVGEKIDTIRSTFSQYKILSKFIQALQPINLSSDPQQVKSSLHTALNNLSEKIKELANKENLSLAELSTIEFLKNIAISYKALIANFSLSSALEISITIPSQEKYDHFVSELKLSQQAIIDSIPIQHTQVTKNFETLDKLQSDAAIIENRLASPFYIESLQLIAEFKKAKLSDLDPIINILQITNANYINFNILLCDDKSYQEIIEQARIIHKRKDNKQFQESFHIKNRLEQKLSTEPKSLIVPFIKETIALIDKSNSNYLTPGLINEDNYQKGFIYLQRSAHPIYLTSQESIEKAQAEFFRIFDKYFVKKAEENQTLKTLTIQKEVIKNTGKFPDDNLLNSIDSRLVFLKNIIIDLKTINGNFLNDTSDISTAINTYKNQLNGFIPQSLKKQMEDISAEKRGPFIHWVRINIFKPIQQFFTSFSDNPNSLFATIGATTTEKTIIEITKKTEEDLSMEEEYVSPSATSST